MPRFRTYFRLPISLRLTLWYGVSMVVLLLLFAGLLLTGLHWNRHAVLHQRLFQVQTDLQAEVQLTEGQPQLARPLAARQPVFDRAEPFETYVRLLGPEGIVLDQSTNFADRPPWPVWLPESPVMEEVRRHWGGASYQSLYVPLRAEGALVGWLEVSGQAFDAHHEAFQGSVAWALLATVLLALVGGYVLARHALRPVVRLNAAATHLTATNLHTRLPVEAPFRDELTDLAETFNRMLARLEQAFAQERRFTANAAHELLNPLAAVQNEIEVTLRRDRAPAAYQATLQSIQADVARLGNIVAQLLDLARLDGAVQVPTEVLDGAAYAEARVRHWQATAQARGVSLTYRDGVAAPLCLHEAHLSMLLDNLLDNALKYTPAGGTVTVQVSREGDDIRLTITDTGVGFTEEEAAHLTDRFYRAATPDVLAHAGSGLGLALVEALVHAYGGRLVARSAGPGQGSTFAVYLPAAG